MHFKNNGILVFLGDNIKITDAWDKIVQYEHSLDS